MLATFVLGTFQSFYMIARQVYAYDIVGPSQAINGIALLSIAQRVGGIGGALLAGGLIAWQGPGSTFLAMSVGYVVGLMALYWLRQPGESAPQSRERLWQNVLGYLQALKTNRVMLSLMISTSASETFGFSHQVMLPILAKDVLDVGSAGLGVLTAFRYAGGALGAIILTALGEVRRRGLLLLLVLALFGGGLILLSQAPNFWVALVVVIFINVMSSASDILHLTLLQLNVPNDQRGRAMGSWIVSTGTGPVGQLEIGYLAGLTTARVALLTNGVALAVMPFNSACTLTSPSKTLVLQEILPDRL